MKKNLAAVVPVMKHMVVTVARLDGERSEREFFEELASKLALGYVVRSHRKEHREVVIELEKVEDWTMEEFASDIRKKLA